MGDELLVPTGNELRPTALERLPSHEPDINPATSTRSLSLATPEHPQFTVIPDPVAGLGRVAPGVDFPIRAIGPGLPDELTSGRLDLVLADAEVEEALGLDGATRRARVIPEPFRCVLRCGHPALGQELDLAAYAALPHVLVSTGGRRHGHHGRDLAEQGVRVGFQR